MVQVSVAGLQARIPQPGVFQSTQPPRQKSSGTRCTYVRLTVLTNRTTSPTRMGSFCRIEVSPPRISLAGEGSLWYEFGTGPNASSGDKRDRERLRLTGLRLNQANKSSENKVETTIRSEARSISRNTKIHIRKVLRAPSTYEIQSSENRFAPSCFCLPTSWR